MKIVVFGAGAIGSLFGALLAEHHSVIIVGRPSHISCIKKKGLTIKGKTHLTINVDAVESAQQITTPVDLILLTVKSYDTIQAVTQVRPLLQKSTMIVSLQNGLDNIEKIAQQIEKTHILAGVTTHGALFSGPGVITHTGLGTTVLGELDGRQTSRLVHLVNLFNRSGIQTQMSTTIIKEIWKKAVINSSINPLTAFLECKNGYLLENPILEKVVEAICRESSFIASSNGIILSFSEMIQVTKTIIRDTAQNSSSMLQSLQQGKKTEIDSINGALIRRGVAHRLQTPLNSILYDLISQQSSI